MKTPFLFFALCVAATAAQADVPAFSTLKSGQALPSPLRFIALPNAKSNVASLVDDAGVTVLKVVSNASAGSVNVPLTATRDMGNTTLTWRWRVSRVLDTADLDKKSADDFAARVYVFFDVPLASLSFAERSKIRLARAVAGAEVPTAALCYVWDNKHRIGYTEWSPYTTRARRIVLQTGPANVNQWMNESRDVAADFKEAFGVDAPAVTGIAIGNDTDNTEEAVTTWFGDFAFIKKN